MKELSLSRKILFIEIMLTVYSADTTILIKREPYDAQIITYREPICINITRLLLAFGYIKPGTCHKPIDSLNYLPELKDYKPSDVPIEGSWWVVGKEGSASRLRVLYSMLAELTRKERSVQGPSKLIEGMREIVTAVPIDYIKTTNLKGNELIAYRCGSKENKSMESIAILAKNNSLYGFMNLNSPMSGLSYTSASFQGAIEKAHQVRDLYYFRNMNTLVKAIEKGLL